MKYANTVQENISMTMLTREITFPFHTVIKQMISVISSLCVKMCMNSGKTYVPVGIHLIMTMLIFKRSQMWKLSSSDRNLSLKLWLYWTFVYFTWNIIFIDSDCFRTLCSISIKSKMRHSQNWKSEQNISQKENKNNKFHKFEILYDNLERSFHFENSFTRQSMSTISGM